jgi:3-oxoadipate enol-lactonase
LGEIIDRVDCDRQSHNLSGTMNTLRAVTCTLLVLCLGAAPRPVSAQPGTPKPGGAFVSVPGSRLHYEECGRGAEAVVLIHDGVVNSAVWDDVWPAFCRRFHTIRYDRRGFGRSPTATEWHSETDDLSAVLRQAGVTRATLVGSSHGGEVSIDFTLAHPELVRRLVLVGAVVGGFPYTEHFIARVVANFDLLGKGDVPGGLRAIANDRYVIAPGNDAARKKLLDLLTANPHDVTHPNRIITPKPALPRLGEIRVPTLLLVGDADIPDVHAHAGAIEAGIPGARRIVVRGVGHLMYLEKPEEFARRVIGFIEANPTP